MCVCVCVCCVCSFSLPPPCATFSSVHLSSSTDDPCLPWNEQAASMAAGGPTATAQWRGSCAHEAAQGGWDPTAESASAPIVALSWQFFSGNGACGGSSSSFPPPLCPSWSGSGRLSWPRDGASCSILALLAVFRLRLGAAECEYPRAACCPRSAPPCCMEDQRSAASLSVAARSFHKPHECGSCTVPFSTAATATTTTFTATLPPTVQWRCPSAWLAQSCAQQLLRGCVPNDEFAQWWEREGFPEGVVNHGQCEPKHETQLRWEL